MDSWQRWKCDGFLNSMVVVGIPNNQVQQQVHVSYVTYAFKTPGTPY